LEDKREREKKGPPMTNQTTNADMTPPQGRGHDNASNSMTK